MRHYKLPLDPLSRKLDSGVIDFYYREDVVRELMWNLVGLSRDKGGFERALMMLDIASGECETVLDSNVNLDGNVRRVASLVTIGRLIARAAF